MGDLAEYLAAVRNGSETSVDLAAFGETGNDPYAVIWCSDWRWQTRDNAEYAGLRARLAERVPIMAWSPYVDHALTCVNSGTRAINPQRAADPRRATLVMIGNVYDRATVYEWNMTTARQRGARLIAYEGWDHTAYRHRGPSQCVNDYLINLRPPTRGLRCPSTDVPAAAATMATPELQLAGPYSRDC